MNVPTKSLKAITSMRELYIAAFNSGNAAELASLYTEQGQLLLPHNDVIEGFQALKKGFESMLKAGIKSIQLVVVEMDHLGSIAWESGRYWSFGKSGQEIDQGKYIIIWKLQALQWKIHCKMFNTNLPNPD